LGKPEKRKIIAHQRAYHGNTIAAASLSGMYYNHASFGLPLDGFLHVTPPHHYRYAHPGEDEEAFATRLADELDALIVAEGPDTVAAFFTEPVMGSGGVIVPPPTYFEKVQAVLKKHDILLVSDEMITAFGRTGNMFGTTTMGLQPDMLVCAKGLSGAYLPISALMVNARVFDAIAAESDRIGVFGLSFTYSGHPVSAAVAREALRIYEDESIVDHVRDMEPHFLGGAGETAGSSAGRRGARQRPAGGRRAGEGQGHRRGLRCGGRGRPLLRRPEPQSPRQINDGRNVTSGGKMASATMPSRNSPTNGHAALKASEIVTLSAAPWKANIT